MDEPLIRIDPSRTQEIAHAVSLLTQAFEHDPGMIYFTEMAPDPAALRQHIITCLVRAHLRSGHTLWGWRHEGAVIGCAMVEDSHHPLRRALAILRMMFAMARLPRQSIARLNAYAALSQRERPSARGPFLMMLGFGDHVRRQGHGVRLMHALHGHYGPDAHWMLDTERAANLVFYERLGYQLYATEVLGPVSVFKMHRPPPQ